MNTINKFFVKKESRILVLSLLSEFIRHQPPHLHQLLQTALFDNLLKCLQIDTSTRVISLAMTALVMLLPHIPSDLATHLPALFNIYSRMLFWDRERRATTESTTGNEDDEKAEKPPSERLNGWSKLSFLLESEDETVPGLLPYFTFLYGLYPINFMSYIRKPQKYLRHANFPRADELDVQPTEIRQRSEPFRRVHLLHPNFYEMTIESELTDNKRWIKCGAADVVAECMALYSPGEEGHLLVARFNTSKKVDLNVDVPDQSLLDQETTTPIQSRHTSWRNTSSTMVASPDGCRVPALHRKASLNSQSMPSIADSPSLRPVGDSPTLPAHIINPLSHPQLQEILNSQRSARGSMYQALTNDSVASLALCQNHQENSAHVDAYLSSLSKDSEPRSPSLRSSTNDPGHRVAYLHREIQLLRNDLNFERYLKQQHLSHIGQLRRKQLREARVEAETQNLLNSNRGLKSKLDEAKRLNGQMKKESEKSRGHSRKWESDLSAKLRILKDEQKKWALDKEELKRELVVLRDDTYHLRQLVVASEAQALASQQKVQSVEASLDELERLRAEVERLTLALRTYEAGETQVVQAQEREENALKDVEILRMKLHARDNELDQHRVAFGAELQMIRSQLEDQVASNDSKRYQVLSHKMIESALAVSRNRISELQKAHNHLLKRYSALYSAYLELKEARDQDEYRKDESLLGGGAARPTLLQSQTFVEPSPPPMMGDAVRRRNHTFSETESDRHLGLAIPPNNHAGHSGKLETSFVPTVHDSRSPVSGNESSSQSPFGTGNGIGAGAGSMVSENPSLDTHGNPKPKIKPQSDVRIYGRGMYPLILCRVAETHFSVRSLIRGIGGVQNIGKKEKERKDKGKERERDKESTDGKKKNVGIRGIRGLV